ncbi:MAG: hypothetical protein ACKV2V_03915, partial [Blastocatellia bacterium]
LFQPSCLTFPCRMVTKSGMRISFSVRMNVFSQVSCQGLGKAGKLMAKKDLPRGGYRGRSAVSGHFPRVLPEFSPWPDLFTGSVDDFAKALDVVSGQTSEI